MGDLHANGFLIQSRPFVSQGLAITVQLHAPIHGPAHAETQASMPSENYQKGEPGQALATCKHN